jgi:hypothetical protein
MTMRPSTGPDNFANDPDAQLGLNLVGLQGLPLVGRGEIGWLAEQTGRDVEELKKPACAHALAVILAAGGWPIEDSLLYAARATEGMRFEDLKHLDNSRITVFEDTSGGMVAIEEAGKLLAQSGLRIGIYKIGVTDDKEKRTVLERMGAFVYGDINTALEELVFNHR